MIYPMSNIIMLCTINSWNVSESSQAHIRMSYSDMRRFRITIERDVIDFLFIVSSETLKDPRIFLYLSFRLRTIFLFNFTIKNIFFQFTNVFSMSYLLLTNHIKIDTDWLHVSHLRDVIWSKYDDREFCLNRKTLLANLRAPTPFINMRL